MHLQGVNALAVDTAHLLDLAVELLVAGLEEVWRLKVIFVLKQLRARVLSKCAQILSCIPLHYF